MKHCVRDMIRECHVSLPLRVLALLLPCKGHRRRSDRAASEPQLTAFADRRSDSPGISCQRYRDKRLD